jgi:hypothetical protein
MLRCCAQNEGDEVVVLHIFVVRHLSITLTCNPSANVTLAVFLIAGVTPYIRKRLNEFGIGKVDHAILLRWFDCH